MKEDVTIRTAPKLAPGQSRVSKERFFVPEGPDMWQEGTTIVWHKYSLSKSRLK